MQARCAMLGPSAAPGRATGAGRARRGRPNGPGLAPRARGAQQGAPGQRGALPLPPPGAAARAPPAAARPCARCSAGGPRSPPASRSGRSGSRAAQRARAPSLPHPPAAPAPPPSCAGALERVRDGEKHLLQYMEGEARDLAPEAFARLMNDVFRRIDNMVARRWAALGLPAPGGAAGAAGRWLWLPGLWQPAQPGCVSLGPAVGVAQQRREQPSAACAPGGLPGPLHAGVPGAPLAVLGAAACGGVRGPTRAAPPAAVC